MRKTHLLLGAACCLLLSALSANAQTQRKPGLYDVTTTMNMGGAMGGGMSGGTMPSRTTQVCVTQAMIDRFGGPSPAPQRGNCQVTDVSMKPTGMSAKVTCTGNFSGTGNVEATFTDADTIQTKVHMAGTMQMGQNSHPIDMTINSTSVFKGSDCGDVKPITMPAN